jgi:hypothetical protein
MHLFGYLYEDYHDARSFEHKGRITLINLHSLIFSNILTDNTVF